MSSIVLIEAGIEEACMAFLPLNNINDTLLEGISGLFNTGIYKIKL